MPSWHREKRGRRVGFSASEMSFVRAAHDLSPYRLLESSFHSHIGKLQSNSLTRKKRTNQKVPWWTADNLHHIFYSHFLRLYFYTLRENYYLSLFKPQTSKNELVSLRRQIRSDEECTWWNTADEIYTVRCKWPSTFHLLSCPWAQVLFPLSLITE